MKKFTVLFFTTIVAVLFALPFSPSAVAQEDETAEDITQDCTFLADDNAASLPNLKDNTVTTVWKAPAGATLTINSASPMAGLYISWDRDAVGWSLETHRDGKAIPLTEGGTDGFLHEYIPLDKEEYSLTITLKEAAVITDIRVLSPGSLPSWVQTWKPMLEKADMLVYSTHADDELLWFGGTLPTYAGEYQMKVQVAYLIYHGAARGEYFRCHELLDGLWAVGVRNYPMIWREFDDYYCSSLAQAQAKYDETAMQEYATMLLRRFRPEVVIAQDEKGEYGHGVHQLAVKVMKDAIGFSADSSQFPESAQEFGVWNIKKCYLHLYPKNTVVMDWNRPLKAFGGKTGIEMAIEGYQYHKSQTSKWFRVEGEGSKYDCRKFGLYYSTVGPDVEKNDFMENIPPESLVTTAPPTTEPPPTTTTLAPTDPSAEPTLPVQGGVVSTSPKEPPSSGGMIVWVVLTILGILLIGVIALLCYFWICGQRKRGKGAKRFRFGGKR